MSKTNVVEVSGRDTIADPLTELLRSGAERLIHRAVEVELEDLLSAHSDRRTADGKAGVVRNGYLPERELQTGLGPVTVTIPKVRSKTGEAVTFRSALVPPYVRKTMSLEAAVPWLYLKGISSGEMGPALEVLLGPRAKGLSASTVSRLKQVWAHEYQDWCEERLDKDRWVYIWADGVYSGLRAERTKLCALVVLGVNERGEKRFLAMEDGVRESRRVAHRHHKAPQCSLRCIHRYRCCPCHHNQSPQHSACRSAPCGSDATHRQIRSRRLISRIQSRTCAGKSLFLSSLNPYFLAIDEMPFSYSDRSKIGVVTV